MILRVKKCGPVLRNTGAGKNIVIITNEIGVSL